MGLAAFQLEDADLFFGSDNLVAELVERLRQQRFLGVFGASGCGKSSLLRAGLTVRLTTERDGGDAPVVVFTPGPHPFEELAQSRTTRQLTADERKTFGLTER